MLGQAQGIAPTTTLLMALDSCFYTTRAEVKNNSLG